MTKLRKDARPDAADPEVPPGSGDTLDAFDDALWDTRRSAAGTAWRTIERLAEAKTLRRQLTDWDDWDDHAHVH